MNKIDRRLFIRLKKSLKHFNLHIEEKKEYKKLADCYHNNKPFNKISAHKKKYYDYLQSPAWAEIRIDMLSAYPKCSRCDSEYLLQVHHKSYKNIFNEEPEDLEVICKSCHRKEHNI